MKNRLASPGSNEVGDPAQLSDVIVALRRVWRRRLRRQSALPPLPSSQVELLRVVAAHPGIGIAAAARELYLADNSVSTLANQLVRAGLLARTRDPVDARAARLEVTESARARLEEWRARRRSLVERAYHRVSAEDREAISRAIPSLFRLLDQLEAMDMDKESS